MGGTGGGTKMIFNTQGEKRTDVKRLTRMDEEGEKEYGMRGGWG